MEKINNLSITQDIYNLSQSNIGDNIYYYPYKIKHLKKIMHENMDKESQQFISTYSSFKGEVYENIIYELLLHYASNNEYITEFTLKGPHQHSYNNTKNGLCIDIKSQIVYKSGYKDVSEFDGLFKTKDALYFVESTITKSTMSLRKRLRKKRALLEYIFPNYHVKALIIITEEATGKSTFPDYCDIWVTQPIIIDDILKNILKENFHKQPFIEAKGHKFVEPQIIEHTQFKYFNTMSWVLNKSRSHQRFNIDVRFLQSSIVDKYFDIVTKLYIGYMNIDNFEKMVPNSPIKFTDNKVLVVIEKKDENKFIIAYLAKQNSDLQRIDITDGEITVTKKDHKGFSTSEYKYFQHMLKPYHQLQANDIKIVKQKMCET